MKDQPQFENYMETGRNYGLNSLRFWDTEGNVFWFSYTTLVAFSIGEGRGLVCRENAWGPTTGKHLNVIEPDHKARVGEATFNSLYQEAFG